MGYVAVKGGGRAIEESLDLLELQRLSAQHQPSVQQIEEALPELVDQVMGEASLYAPQLAALAVKQALGNPDEAVFLLRAFRSTLERTCVCATIDTSAMRIRRRISAAFKDVPGGQVLGATRDYSHRLLRFELAEEGEGERAAKLRELEERLAQAAASQPAQGEPAGELPRVVDYLRDEGLLPTRQPQELEPDDATMRPLEIPASRSMRLQTLARGMTQAVEALGYAAIRGFGDAHPTVGEIRAGAVDVVIEPPLGAGGAGPRDCCYLGSVPVTEVESVFAAHGEEALGFELGYGLVLGSCETKAIAMSVLDYCLEQGDERYPTQDQEFVLYHVDGVEATGFISHLKLPHYVTFQSKLSSVRSVHGEGQEA